MLDEKALRREGWTDAGEWIVFADGSKLCVPKPTLELVPSAGEGGSLEFGATRRTFGADYDALVERFVNSQGLDEANALLRLAADLLSRNYDLTVENYQALLPLRPADDANNELWQSLADVALGRAPKPSAATSSSPA